MRTPASQWCPGPTQERLAISVPERDIDRVRTVADLVRLVVTHLCERDHPHVLPHARRIGIAA